MSYVGKILNLTVIKIFLFQVEAFEFPKFHENMAWFDKDNDWHNLLEQYPHISMTNFAILFFARKFKRENNF